MPSCQQDFNKILSKAYKLSIYRKFLGVVFMFRFLFTIFIAALLILPLGHAAAAVVRVGLIQADTEVLESVFMHQYYSSYFAELSKLSENRYELTLVPNDKCIDMLKRGEIDVLLPFELPSPTPSTILSYSSMNLGFDVVGLYTSSNQPKLKERNLKKLINARIGLVKDRVANAAFDNFLHDMGLTVQKKYYNAPEEMLADLENNQLDAVVDTATNIDSREELAVAFDTIPLLFATLPEKNYLIADLEKSLKRLKHETPNLTRKLDYDFHAHIDHYLVNYTLNESKFLNSIDSLTIAIYEDNEPFIYFDSSGEPLGIFPDILAKVGDELGLKINYIHAESYEKARELVKSGAATAMLDIFTNDELSDDFYFSNPVFMINYSFIGEHHAKPQTKAASNQMLINLDSNKPIAISMNETTPTIKRYLSHEFPNWYISVDSKHNTLLSVESGSADFALLRDISIAIDRPSLDHPNLALVPGVSVMLPVSLAISSESPQILQMLLNKAIMKISPDEITAITQKHTAMSRPQLSLRHLIAYYPMQTGLAIGFIIIILVSAFALIYHSQQMRKTQELLKSKNAILLGTINRLKEVTAREQQYKNQAITDALTGVLNKAGIEMAGAAILNNPPTPNHVHALFILDLDHFKEANDKNGHQYGDDILCKFSQKLRQVTRNNDALGRFGGDEFILVLENLPEPIVYSVARRIKDAATSLAPLDKNGEPQLSASIGIAIAKDGDTYDKLLKSADNALYEVKKCGRNGWQVAKN